MNEIEEQEKQLYYLQRQKIAQQEKQLLMKDQLILELQSKYKNLYDDYQHNLRVIKDRDEELDEITDKLLSLKQQNDKQLNEYIELEAEIHRKQEEWKLQRDNLKSKNDEQRKEIKYLKRIHEEEINQFQAKYKQTLHQLEQLKNEKLYFKNQQDQLHDQKEQIEQLLQKNNDQKNIIIKLEQASEQHIQINNENAQLQQKLNLQKQQFNEQIAEFQNDNQLLKLKIQQQQQIIDQIKRDHDDQQGQDSINQNKLQNVGDEIKKENQRKVVEGADSTIIEIDSNSVRGEDQKIGILITTLQIQEANQKEKCQEIETKLNRLIFDNEQRVQQLIKNNELDKKQSKNDLDLKIYQITQLNDEIANLKSTINESNKLLDNMAAKIQELKNENNILIEEVVALRKNNNLNNTNKKPQLQQSNPSNKKPSQQQPQQQQPIQQPKMKFLDEEEEVESVEKLLFSGDEGPVSSLLQRGSMQQQIKQSKQSLSKHHRSLEQENTQLKLFVKDMHQTMENTKDQLLLKVQELNIQKQECYQAKEKIQSLQQEILKYKEQILILQAQTKNNEDLESVTSELKLQIENLSKKLQNSKEVILKLKQEREKLLDITNELNQKLKDSDNQEELLQMQTEIKYLQNQIKQLQLQNEIPINQKSQLPNLSEIQNQLFVK
ncbi:unnamed protein product (macronuclear) [Paramecium tetraurelia]|uniref:Uncharacterized protein n=1 Tax=Paramecium tetraurelia TaxID=5888 RepID=A0C8P0_PARTE|nr:uncharacterized protein GSPATT00036292001 [Paramecium tetraurelia]CAK67157.1 unnamed protein product [Paramecium tetraurelia]|eukprot:XP_001434554.1 hypothetical protein (macronuclear) [Paramecium tetraurelia strain d4-2]